MTKKPAIPGIVRPATAFRSADRRERPRTIEEKRAAVIRSIERWQRGEPRASRLEQHDDEQNAPIIRVLYGSKPLPIFDGQAAAIIDPKTDRAALWKAIITAIAAGDYDREIEEVSSLMVSNLTEGKRRKRVHEAA